MTLAWVQIDSQGFKAGPQFCGAVPITSPHLSSWCLVAHKAFSESLHSSRLAATVFTSCCEDRPQCSHDTVNFSCFCGFFNKIFFMGEGYQASALGPAPNLEDQTRGPHLDWSISLDLFDKKTSADIVPWVVETRKPLHHSKVVVPLEWNPVPDRWSN